MRRLPRFITVVLIASAGMPVSASYPFLQSPSSDMCDKMLAKAMVDELDAGSVVYEQSVINSTIDNSFRNGALPELHKTYEALKAEETTLAKMNCTDPIREGARMDLLVGLDDVANSLGTMSTGLFFAKANGEWTDQARTMCARAVEKSQNPTTNGGVAKLLKDSKFQAQLPRLFLELNGIIPDQAGFRFGISTYVRDSLYLTYVKPGSLGEKLKLVSLERVEQFDGKTPRDMDDLKQMIKKAVGQIVKIKVKPKFGDEKEYEVAVPPTLAK